MRFYAMLDTDEIRYLGDWDTEVYGSAFDEAAEAADKINGGSYHWILDEDGLARISRTGRDAVLKTCLPDKVSGDEFAIDLGNGYELRTPPLDFRVGGEPFTYVRLVEMMVNGDEREIVYWEEKEFEDIHSVLPALFGAIQRAVYNWGFKEIGIE